MTIANGPCGDSVTWRLEDDGILHIEGTGAMDDYASASQIPWYSYRSQITGLIVGADVTHISKVAFYECVMLADVDLGGVTSLGDRAFFGCQNASVTGTSALTAIGPEAFRGCTSLTSIDLPSIQTIGARAFHSSGITQLDFPESLQTLDQYSIAGCPQLEAVVLPTSFTALNAGVFASCSSLTTINLDHVETIGYAAFQDTGLLTVSMERIQTIGSKAFYRVNGLEEVTFGPDLIDIGDMAFGRYFRSSNPDRCEQTFRFEGAKPTFGDHAIGFYEFDSTTYADSKVTSYTTGFGATGQSNKFYSSHIYSDGFGAGITHTVEGAALTLSGSGDTYTYDPDCNIPLEASSCTSMSIAAGISINASMTEKFKDALVSLTAGIQTIPSKAFFQFAKLESVDLSGVRVVEAGAFQECTLLRTATLTGVVTIGKQAFSNCSLESVILDKVETIGERAFAQCYIKRLTLPETLTTIGAYAFECHSLNGVIVPASVSSIGASAFSSQDENPYKKHLVLVFRGAWIPGTATSSKMMVYEFCKTEPETYSRYDYSAGAVNCAHPVMIKTQGGWRVISTDMIDVT